MLEKCLQGKTQKANESFNGITWNRVPKTTHVRLDVLSVGLYDAIVLFKIGEKAALDIMELLKIDPGYYMTKCSRSGNERRKHLSIYRMSEPQKKRRKVLCHSKKQQQDKNIETEGTQTKRGAFKIQYKLFGFISCCFTCIVNDVLC